MIELRPAKYLLGRLAPMDNNDKIPQFNLGAGTYNSTVYLRGDGVWANPLAGAGFVPLTRELTINGVTYDLSVNRTWTIDKASVGLGNVDNTSDLNKPISTATQTALNAKENTANKGIPGGYASLAGDGKVPSDQLPSYVDDVIEVANYAALPTVGQTGVIYITLDNNNVYRWAGSVYVQISQPNAVWGSITGTLSNQTDLQNALNAKQDDITLTTTGTSGAATFIGNTLNIPQYSQDLSGYVPYTGATANVNLGEYGISAGWIRLDTSPTTYVAGTGGISWNSTDGTADLELLNGVTLQIGQELHFYAKATEVIPNGSAVMFAGVQGNHLLIAKAERTVLNANPNYFMGVATQDFVNNEFGYVTAFGNVRGLNTTAYSLGAVLYYDSTSATPGLLTATMPNANLAKIEVAAVVRVHANQGILMVRPHVMPMLNEIQDVNTNLSKSTPVDADSVLLQDTADSNIWKKLSWLNTKATLKTYFDTLYQGVGSYVPTSRTLTVNGTTYDLSANRSWTIDKAAVGLGNVDNTSDLNKPISTATQTALNAKQDNITLTTSGTSGAATLVGATLNIPQYQSVITNPITGTGTTNYVSKFTGSGSIGDSLIFDNGFNVGIGTATPFRQLDVNGALRLQTGTIDFGNSTNNQIWVASNNINFKTNGSEKAIITSGGYFGVGTSIPSSILHLSGTSTLLTITDNTYGRTSNIGYLDQANLYFANDSNSNTYIGRYNNLFLVYGGGSVGIGTENPNQKLDVVGNARIRNGSYDGTIFFGDSNSNYFGYYSNDSYYKTIGNQYFQSEFSYKGVWDSAGNLGVGTTNPNDKFHVVGGIYSTSIDNPINGSIGAIQVGYDGTNGRVRTWNSSPLIYTSYNYQSWETTGSERMRIAANGNVGIGTTNPAYQLSIEKFGNTYNINPHLAGVDLHSTGNIAPHYQTTYDWYTGAIGSGSFKMRLTNSGDLGIGTTNPTEKLDVVGNVKATLFNINGNGTLSQNGFWGTLNTKGTGSYSDWTLIDSVGNGIMWNPSGTLNMAFSNNVGIGTTSPDPFKLAVNGTVGVVGTLNSTLGSYYIDHPGVQSWKIGITNTNTSTLHIGNDIGGAFANKILNITNVGDVAIGTTSALLNTSNRGNLTINGAWESILTLGVGGVWKSYFFADGINTHLSSANALILGTNGGAERIRITNAGNVGVGTSSPNYTLDVNGFIGATRLYAYNTGDTFLTGDGGGLTVDGNGYLYVKASGGSYFQNAVRFRNIISNDINSFLQINGGTTGVTYFAGTIGVGGSNVYHGSSIQVGNGIFYAQGNASDIGGKIYGYWDTGFQPYAGGLKFQVFRNQTGSYQMYDAMTLSGNGNVGIGTISPDPSAILHLESTTKGFLPPRMDNSEINSISNPAEGLIVYSTQSKCLFLFDGASWQKIAFA